jgi:nitric oxide reductase subunit B
MQRLWLAFAGVLVVSFAILGWIGTRIYQEMPPLSIRVETTDGQLIIDAEEIAKGQNVWQTLGGMEVGSVWGHGSCRSGLDR